MILLCSGTTVTWAHHSLIHGDRHGLRLGLLLTIQIPIVVDGQVTGIFGIARDITETRKAGEALRASEQRFRAVWEHAADAMVRP